MIATQQDLQNHFRPYETGKTKGRGMAEGYENRMFLAQPYVRYNASKDMSRNRLTDAATPSRLPFQQSEPPANPSNERAFCSAKISSGERVCPRQTLLGGRQPPSAHPKTRSLPYAVPLTPKRSSRRQPESSAR